MQKRMVFSRFGTAMLFEALLVQSCIVCITNCSSNFTDQSALLAFKSKIIAPDDILKRNWTISTNFCNWHGVSCSIRRQRVTALRLPEMGLSGTISPNIGNLSFLVVLDLTNNKFDGHLTHELSRLVRLRKLILQGNRLEGTITPSLFHCQSLQVIALASNKLSGTIPQELGFLPQLQTLYLGLNNLEPPIPSTLSNLSTLQNLGLGNMGLTGSIPSFIFNMSSLVNLHLSNNSISHLPQHICQNNPRLETLYLTQNQLYGQFPISNLSQCRELRELLLKNNRLHGSIPEDLSSTFPKLASLVLTSNDFTGVIPPSLGNISGLEELWLGANNIQGHIPVELGHLTNLASLTLERNMLAGGIPSQIFNISSLRDLYLSWNPLSRALPSSNAFQLPNLERLYLNDNQLGGGIPESLSNASKLRLVDLGDNFLTGPVPTSLGNLRLLQRLQINHNLLTGNQEGAELSFLAALTNCKFLERLIIGVNPLNGILPHSIGNLSNSLQVFIANRCQIKGSIPSGIGSLRNLNLLALFNNHLTGTIPSTIGELKRLQRLYLGGNKIEGLLPNELCHLRGLGEMSLESNMLTGSIPNCIGDLSRLQKIYLSSNNLTSPIPVSVWNLENLLILNLSLNSLDGQLPLEIRMSIVMESMDISYNQMSGEIPSTIGTFESLSSLNLSGNSFQGSIPQSFGDLLSLEFIDLSQNNLSGIIPKSLEALSHLKYLNLSSNKLSGEIPNGGAFANFTASSFIDNEALCGLPIFQVPPCGNNSSSRSMMKKTVLRYVLPAVLFLSSVLLTIFVARNCRKKQLPVSVSLVPAMEHRMISYQELCRATGNFCETNLLGVGSFASVYKGLLADGELVAVKLLKLQIEGAFKSFEAECKVLRTVRHRNLVKVISTCSNPEFRAIILQYMPNGSLEKWLYSHNYCLDFFERVSIITDVALALEYLHYGQSEPVVHCDLKPSNVLLDDEMVAHVGDFGIAKILIQNCTSTNTKTLGTLGYIAPEYGSEGRVSTKGDIYSYGIMLLETFTRKKPTDEMFGGGLSLRQWVNASLPDRVTKVVDTNLLRVDNEGGEVETRESHLSSIMKLGLECSEELPDKRIDIKDVVVKLRKIKLQILQEEGASTLLCS